MGHLFCYALYIKTGSANAELENSRFPDSAQDNLQT